MKKFNFIALIFFYTSVAHALPPLRYGTQTIELRSIVGSGGAFRIMANSETRQLLWLKYGDFNSQIFSMPFKGQRWNEASGSITLTNFGKRSFFKPVYDSDRQEFFFVSDETGDESFNIYRYREGEQKLSRVTSRGYAYSYTLDRKNNSVVYVARLEQSGNEVCLEEKEIVESGLPPAPKQHYCHPDIYPYEDPILVSDGRYVAFVRSEQGNLLRKNLVVFDRQKEEFSVLTDTTVPRNQVSILGGHENDIFYMADDTGKMSLYSMNVVTGQRRTIFEGKGQSADGFYDEESFKVGLVEQVSGKFYFSAINLRSNETETRFDMGPHRLNLVSTYLQSLGKGLFVVPASKANTLGNGALVFNLHAKRLEDWVVSEFIPQDELAIQPLCRREIVWYDTFDIDPSTGKTRQIDGVLFHPSRAVSHPMAMVYAHGGPSLRVTTGYNGLLDTLCNLGYTILAANPRGSTGRGREFENLNNGDWGGGDYLDYVHAKKYLMEHQGFTADQIGIAGGSYGGYMVNWALTRPAQEFAFGISSAGISDLYAGFIQGSGRENYLEEMGDPRSSPSIFRLYQERSPIHGAANVEKPILLLHGEVDTRVPVEQARVFYNHLRWLNKDVTYVELKGEGHAPRYFANVHNFFQGILDFLWRVAPLE